MAILAIDTAMEAASACVCADDGALLARENKSLQKGHDIHLPGLVETVISKIPSHFSALTRIAVTIGPGSFTGLRVGLALAQGMGIALNIPVVGVSTLAAFAAPYIRKKASGLIVSCMDARHGRVFLEVVSGGGRSIVPPCLVSLKEAMGLVAVRPEPGAAGLRQLTSLDLVGSAAQLLALEAWAMGLKAEVLGELHAPDITSVARLGLCADPKMAPAAPLYLKEVHVSFPKTKA